MPGPTGDVQGNGDFDFKAFFLDIPPITRTLFITMFFSTLLSGLGLIPITPFLLEWIAVTSKLQIWRVVLTFFHLGGLGIGFLIQIYFLYTYSSQLEMNVFFGRPANYAWFLTIVASIVLICSTIIPSFVNGTAFLIAIVHLWGRHADNVSVSLYGFISIPAKYLSLTMLALEVISSGGIRPADIFGLLGGHLYYFLDSVFPLMPNGKQTIFVPLWFERSVDRAQGFLGYITGLHRGPPTSSPTRSSMQPTSRTQPNPSSTGPRAAGLRPRFPGTNPNDHSWGSGHTLGSA